MARQTTPSEKPPIIPHEEDFPTFGSADEKLRFLLGYAILSPSTHNTQPWKWTIVGNEAELYADRTRLMPGLDPQGRELIMSCGATLEHLRVAIHAFGYADIIQLLPNPVQPELLARVRLAGRRGATGNELALFHAIPQRHTNRSSFSDQPLPVELLGEIETEAELEGAWLRLLTSHADRQAVAELIALAAKAQDADPKARADIADWMSTGSSSRRDGIPGRALGLDERWALLAPIYTRLFGGGEKHANHDWLLAGSAPALAVLGTREDGVLAWLSAGRSLARILLKATTLGVAVSFFSQPVQVEEMWRRLRRIANRPGSPQLVFRMGYPQEEAHPTPRRPVEEVCFPSFSD